MLCRNFVAGPKWFPGVVCECKNWSLQVKLDDGRVWRQDLHLVALCVGGSKAPTVQ